MKSQSVRGFILAIAAAVMLSACQSGALNGLRDAATSDVMPMLAFSYSKGGQLSEAQYLGAQKAAKQCGVQLGPQISGPVETIAATAGGYGLTGGPGTGLGANLAFGAGASIATYTAYAIVPYALTGGYYGAIVWSENNVRLVGDCAERTMRDWEDNGEEIYNNLHVYASMVRTRNRADNPAPGLVSAGPAPAR